MGESLNRVRDAAQRQLVYVIDDDIAVRRSLNFLLATSGYTTWPFACALDFLDNLADLSPAPILLDVRMSEMDGIDLLTELFKRAFKWPVIVITGHADISIAVQAMKLGAFDFLEKPLDFELLEAVLGSAIVELSSVVVASEIQSGALCLFKTLSPREFGVLVMLMDGLSNKVIAHRLSLSVRTVEMHRANILQKLKVKKIAEVSNLARDAGMILTEKQSGLRMS